MSLSNSDKMYPSLIEKIEEYADPASQTIPQDREFASKENSINHTCPAMQILVTPTPKLNAKSKFTKEDAKRVLERQLTMQLMPMYRIRQKSAGLRPIINISKPSEPI